MPTTLFYSLFTCTCNRKKLLELWSLGLHPPPTKKRGRPCWYADGSHLIDMVVGSTVVLEAIICISLFDTSQKSMNSSKWWGW